MAETGTRRIAGHLTKICRVSSAVIPLLRSIHPESDRLPDHAGSRFIIKARQVAHGDSMQPLPQYRGWAARLVRLRYSILSASLTAPLTPLLRIDPPRPDKLLEATTPNRPQGHHVNTPFDPNLLRIILAAVGVVIVLAILLWGMRRRPRSSARRDDRLPPGALDEMDSFRQSAGEPDDEMLWNEAESLGHEVAAQRNPDSIAEGIIGPVRVIARREKGSSTYTPIEPEVRLNDDYEPAMRYTPPGRTSQPAAAASGRSGGAAQPATANRQPARPQPEPPAAERSRRPEPEEQTAAADRNQRPIVENEPEPAAIPPFTDSEWQDGSHQTPPPARVESWHKPVDPAPPAVVSEPPPAPVAPPPPEAPPGPARVKQPAEPKRPQQRHDELGAEEKIIAIHITAPKELLFTGHGILRATQETGLEYGDLNIYHRIDQRVSNPVFSLANMVKPGYFPIEEMDDFTTPGITLFMRLPNPLGGVAAFDEMYASAQRMAGILHGEVRDTSRSMMSRQTAEHIRDGVIEFELKMRTRRANHNNRR